MFYSPYFFTIALRKRTDKDILEDSSFQVDYVIACYLCTLGGRSHIN